MSTSYDIRCTTCPGAPTLGVQRNANRRDDELLDLLRLRTGLEALADVVERVQPVHLRLALMIWHECNADLGFFHVHRGHTLRVFNEYGFPADLCGRFHDDPGAHRDRWCSRPTGHVPPCRYDSNAFAPATEDGPANTAVTAALRRAEEASRAAVRAWNEVAVCEETLVGVVIDPTEQETARCGAETARGIAQYLERVLR